MQTKRDRLAKIHTQAKKPTEIIELETPQSKSAESSGLQIVDKQKRLALKQLDKFHQQINHCCLNIQLNNISQAILALIDIISQGKHLDHFPFIGVGMHENWQWNSPHGPLQWFTILYEGQSVTKNPFDLLSICFMIGQHGKKMNIQEVESVYDKIEQMLPNSPEVYVGRGNAFYNDWQFLKAEENYLKALETLKSQKVYENLGWVQAFRFGKLEGIQNCRRCLQINPSNIGANIIKAQLKSNKIQAKKEFNEILNSHPDHYLIYSYLGDLEIDLRPKKEYYDKTIYFNPNCTLAKIQKCHMYLDILITDGAMKKLNKLVQQMQHEYLVWFVLGMTYLKMKDTKNAVQNIEKCLSINPYHFPSYRALSYVQFLAQDYQKCALYSKKFIELNPYSFSIFNQLAISCEHLNKTDEAIKYFKKVVELNPQHFQSLQKLGKFYFKNQMHVQALYYLEMSHEIYPEKTDIMRNIIFCHILAKRYESGQKWAKKCQNLQLDKHNFYQYLGDLFLFKKNYLKALTWYLKLVNYSQKFITDQLLKQILLRITKNEAITLLHEILYTSQRTSENIYLFLQITYLFFELEEYEEAINCREYVQFIGSKNWLKRSIRDKIKELFGNQQMGVAGLLHELHLNTLKIKYKRIFSTFYQEQSCGK